MLWWSVHIDGFVQERRNSIVTALELRLSCTNPSICADQNGSTFEVVVSIRVDFKSLRYPKGSKYMNLHVH